MTHLGRIPLSHPNLYGGGDLAIVGEIDVTGLRHRPGVGLEVKRSSGDDTTEWSSMSVALTSSEAVELHTLLSGYLGRPCSFKVDDLPRAAQVFRDAWNKADGEGQEGKRVEAGLLAALRTLGFDEEI